MSDTPTTPESQPPPPSPEQVETSPAASTVTVTPKPRSALALSAMIAGFVAMVTAVIPGLSFVAWLPALLAISLGVIALVRKTTRRGQALAGVILGPIAWIVAIIVSISFIAGLGGQANDVVANEPTITDEEPAPSNEATEPAPEPEPEPEPAPEPEIVEPAADVVYTGSGDTILQIELPAGPDSIGIATMTHSGSSNFAVWSLDENLQQADLLVNEIGTYNGTVPFNLATGERITAFEISADGPWTVTLRDALSLREVTPASATTGEGDDVMLYFGDTTVADVTHTGDSNFVVYSYGEFSDLLINEIGAYTGQVRWPAGAALIQVSANGPWTITLQ